MRNDKAALYLRSSKDRSDVSIDAQRRDLEALARSRGLTIAREYADVVQSAKTANRPGFQQLLLDMRRPDRGWSFLLTVDTSRLSRRRYWAQAFKHEAEKRGITIVYSKVPDVDPITQVILESVLEAMDEVHSLMSREKGLAGMAENVRQGWRAGGRAPTGYRLVRVETSTIRDGKPVMKSRLEPDGRAPAVQKYLKARAAGRPRSAVAHILGLSGSTLVCLEWQALTYAGYTVWNVHAEAGSGRKRRPREEWIVSPEPTHEPLITREEAEALLDRLGRSPFGRRVSDGKRAASAPLLTGYLKTSDGRKWTADRRYYRLANEKYVPQADLDAQVLAAIRAHLRTPESIRGLIREAAQESGLDLKPLKAQIAGLDRQIRKTIDLAASLDDPAPVARRVNELEAERRALADELAEVEAEIAARKSVAAIGPGEIQAAVLDAEPRSLLAAVVEHIVLDPDMGGRIVYRLSVASPRGVEGSPILVSARISA